MRKSELCGNIEREIRRGFPATFVVTKVTECLNESSRLLAQNLAQTMDEVTRDVLSSTSSVQLCSNGVNGRNIAVLKSLVIDLEAYGVSYGDRAQAGEYLCAA